MALKRKLSSSASSASTISPASVCLADHQQAFQQDARMNQNEPCKKAKTRPFSREASNSLRLMDNEQMAPLPLASSTREENTRILSEFSSFIIESSKPSTSTFFDDDDDSIALIDDDNMSIGFEESVTPDIFEQSRIINMHAVEQQQQHDGPSNTFRPLHDDTAGRSVSTIISCDTSDMMGMPTQNTGATFMQHPVAIRPTSQSQANIRAPGSQRASSAFLNTFA